MGDEGFAARGSSLLHRDSVSRLADEVDDTMADEVTRLAHSLPSASQVWFYLALHKEEKSMETATATRSSIATYREIFLARRGARCRHDDEISRLPYLAKCVPAIETRMPQCHESCSGIAVDVD